MAYGQNVPSCDPLITYKLIAHVIFFLPKIFRFKYFYFLSTKYETPVPQFMENEN